jgi:hypothetical protein
VPVAATGAGLIFGLILITALLGVAVICAMKGKWVFFAIGWFSGIFWIIGASRLALPDSFWARRWYGDAKMAEAKRRFARRMRNRERGPWVPFPDHAREKNDDSN